MEGSIDCQISIASAWDYHSNESEVFMLLNIYEYSQWLCLPISTAWVTTNEVGKFPYLIYDRFSFLVPQFHTTFFLTSLGIHLNRLLLYHRSFELQMIVNYVIDSKLISQLQIVRRVINFAQPVTLNLLQNFQSINPWMATKTLWDSNARARLKRAMSLKLKLGMNNLGGRVLIL